MATVTCKACRHRAEVSAPSDVWKCNCAAGVSEDAGCVCDAVNVADDPVEVNPPDVARGEIAALEARLVVLRGGVAPEGGVRGG